MVSEVFEWFKVLVFGVLENKKADVPTCFYKLTQTA
jgi:hypothetical protein